MHIRSITKMPAKGTIDGVDDAGSIVSLLTSIFKMITEMFNAMNVGNTTINNIKA